MNNIIESHPFEPFLPEGAKILMLGTGTPEESIQAIHEFYESIGIPMTLREVGIDDSRIDEMARHIADNEGLDKAWVPFMRKTLQQYYEIVYDLYSLAEQRPPVILLFLLRFSICLMIPRRYRPVSAY